MGLVRRFVDRSNDEDVTEADVLPEEGDSSERAAVREQVEEVKEFVEDLSLDDLRTGDWFTKLLGFALSSYHRQVNADYFRDKYPGLPPDAIARARVQLASRYAMIEGGLSSAAYTGLVASTIGSGGAASPFALPAGGASFVVDLSYTSYLQLRMAYDLAVIYGVQVDLDDPEDMWKLVRIAFAIKSGEVGSGAAMKAVPALVRPVVKRVYSGGVLQAAKTLPVVGKHLLQRNVIKFAVPVVGVPVSVATNYWTTRVAGDHAISTWRRDARILEAANRIVASTQDHEALVWAMWSVMSADGTHGESQRSLFHHVTKHFTGDDELLSQVQAVVEVDPIVVEKALADRAGDAGPLYRACLLAAAVDGSVSKDEHEQLERIAGSLGVEHDPARVAELAKEWK